MDLRKTSGGNINVGIIGIIVMILLLAGAACQGVAVPKQASASDNLRRYQVVCTGSYDEIVEVPVGMDGNTCYVMCGGGGTRVLSCLKGGL